MRARMCGAFRGRMRPAIRHERRLKLDWGSCTLGHAAVCGARGGCIRAAALQGVRGGDLSARPCRCTYLGAGTGGAGSKRKTSLSHRGNGAQCRTGASARALCADAVCGRSSNSVGGRMRAVWRCWIAGMAGRVNRLSGVERLRGEEQSWFELCVAENLAYRPYRP